jgi:hypothetical protein
MPPKADKLSQILENLQLFLRKRFDDSEEFKEISRSLSKLQISLKQKKLSVQIVSDRLSLAQGLYDLIQTNEQLKEVYLLKFDFLPQIPQSQTNRQIAGLKVKQTRDKDTDLQQYYRLDYERAISIGRSPECDITLDSNLYRGVSWNHATIEPIINKQNLVRWQICDRQSTNGTFVNGERIQQSKLLKSGDTITLAYPHNGLGIAEIILEIRDEAIDNEVDREYWDLVDCDLLFIAIDGQQPLSVKEKAFIQNFDKTFISKQYIIADIPDAKQDAEAAKLATTNLENLANWLKNEVPGKEFELLSIYLQPYYNANTNIELDIKLQKEQTSFFKALENAVKRQPENILAKRLSIKVIKEVESIKPFFLEQQALLSQKITSEEQKLASFGEGLTLPFEGRACTPRQINWKEITKKTMSQVEREKDTLFKQIKLDLSQSKAAVLDNYSKKSIIYRIQNFVDDLTPKVVTKNGQKTILLKDEANPNSNDINTSLIDFCIASVKEWSIAEWQNIIDVYCHGGLNGFLQRAYNKVNIIPDLFSESPFFPPDNIEIENNFLLSFAGTHCETVYKQKSPLGYVVKELRSNIMAIMMPVMLLIPLVVVDNKVSKGKIFGTLAQVFNQYPWVFGIVVCIVIYFLITSYQKDDEEKLEEAGQKLKKDLAVYYQSFTKSLLEKVIQDINLALEAEDKKINDSLELVGENYTERLSSIEREQAQIKSDLEKYKNQQKTLEAELSEFEKLEK